MLQGSHPLGEDWTKVQQQLQALAVLSVGRSRWSLANGISAMSAFPSCSPRLTCSSTPVSQDSGGDLTMGRLGLAAQSATAAEGLKLDMCAVGKAGLPLGPFLQCLWPLAEHQRHARAEHCPQQQQQQPSGTLPSTDQQFLLGSTTAFHGRSFSAAATAAPLKLYLACTSFDMDAARQLVGVLGRCLVHLTLDVSENLCIGVLGGLVWGLDSLRSLLLRGRCQGLTQAELDGLRAEGVVVRRVGAEDESAVAGQTPVKPRTGAVQLGNGNSRGWLAEPSVLQHHNTQPAGDGGSQLQHQRQHWHWHSRRLAAVVVTIAAGVAVI